MKYHEGIRTHMCMGVEPHPIHLTSSKKIAKMEKGFSFEIPKESRERLKKHFLKHVDEDGSRIEKRSSHHEEKYNDR